MLSAIDKYLTAHAEPLFDGKLPVGAPWDSVVVIPFLDEIDFIDDCLTSLERAAQASAIKALVLVVVNSRTDHPTFIHQANEGWLNTISEKRYLNLCLCPMDHTSTGRRFSQKDGVGLARKIGCDFALRLWRENKIKSDLLRTTDADARVPTQYFSSPLSPVRLAGWPEGNPSGFCYPYQHRFNEQAPKEALALKLYEIHLRYYEWGLKKANSLYAFPTIGSTLAIPMEAYAQARGFPKRNAAEDFYLLGKLAHLGPVYLLSTAPIHLEQRLSNRVPFGTGQATIDLSQTEGLLESFTLYDPSAFEGLARLLEALKTLSHHRNPIEFRKSFDGASDWRMSRFQKMGGFEAIEQAIRTRPTAASLERHLLCWFDALKTLQFIKAKKELPWRMALAKSGFGFSAETSVEEILGHFRGGLT